MEYNLKVHGDHLEKAYADFITNYFKTYEAVWKLFIGNKGNDTKADIEHYSSEEDQKRQKFSEHTYTVLQSVVLLHRFIEKDVFNKGTTNTTDGILDLQDHLLLFFSHLGRIRDNVIEATRQLGLTEDKISNLLEEFYYKRHILVHGKTLPIVFKQSGEILAPVLSKDGTDLTGWCHKEHSWKDVAKLPTEEVNQTAFTLFWELLPKLEEIFGQFKKAIELHLKERNLQLKFEYNDDQDVQRHGSGSLMKASNSGACAVSVYGLDRIDRTKW